MFIKNPCLLVIDSIASRCYDVISVQLSVKKSTCDHILWIVLLHLYGDGSLIATLSLTLFLFSTEKSDKEVKKYEFAVILNLNGGILNATSAISMTLSFHRLYECQSE